MSTEKARAAGIAIVALVATGCPSGVVLKQEIAPAVSSVPDLSTDGACGVHDAAALMACVSRRRVEADVRSIAKARSPGSPHHAAVRADCEKRFRELGFETWRHDYGTGINILGRKSGFSKPTELVVVGAHYDQAGSCAGADDNATGIAALLETARVLAPARFDRSLILACWDEGERGQLGSIAHATLAHQQAHDIRLAVSLEAIGFTDDAKRSQRVPEDFDQAFPDQALALLDNDYRADFLIVVAESATESWAQRVVTHGKAVDLTVHTLTLTERMKVKQRELHRSDHASFWDRGFPAMLLTDSGPFRNAHNGCNQGADAPATLNFGFLASTTQVGVGAIAEVLQIR